jgi:murein DD-endopeptidase MepM/ murein hydrolase activator NlpD
MTRTLPLRSALVVLLVSLVVAQSASARSDGSAQLQMVWPASGTVTAPFGVWRGDHAHTGVDIALLRSLRLRAVSGGIVRETGYASGYSGYGQVVVLDLPGNLSALYAHLADVHVRVGDRVQKGELLGLAGSTGNSSGTHLHFEIRRSGTAVNPMSYLD